MTTMIGKGPPWPTLPGRDYHAPEVFAFERDAVFASSWMCVGRAEQLPEPGDYLTAEVAGETPIVLRGEDGVLRAFANTCRHRGTMLLEGSGSVRKVIKCPYHAWTYALDGRLAGSPNVHADDGIEPRRDGPVADPARGVGGLRLPEPRRTGSAARRGGRDPARLADRARAIRGG